MAPRLGSEHKSQRPQALRLNSSHSLLVPTVSWSFYLNDGLLVVGRIGDEALIMRISF